jgi:hypothetical protein
VSIEEDDIAVSVRPYGSSFFSRYCKYNELTVGPLYQINVNEQCHKKKKISLPCSIELACYRYTLIC